MSTDQTAQGRVSILRVGDPGQPTVLHRFWGESFVHNYNGDRTCPCHPIIVPADDPRTMNEIMDDLEAEEHYVH